MSIVGRNALIALLITIALAATVAYAINYLNRQRIAELTAILRGLQALGEAEHARPVLVYSDSSYSIGLFSQAWKAKANVDLVAELRAVCRKFADLRFVKVLGHSGVPLNERTDELARLAVQSRGR